MMNLKELKKLVFSGESDRLEFKNSTGQRTAAMKTVCGMLNGLGGFVLFGVSDKGGLVGQDITAKTMTDVSAELNRIDPPAFPDVETVILENGNPQPEWRVRAGSVVVTFKPLIDKPERQPASGVESRPESGVESGVELVAESGMSLQILEHLQHSELSKKDIALKMGKSKPTRYLNDLMQSLLKKDVVEYTIPDKPNSRLQRYRLTENGKHVLNR